jgi:hypothetical protein
MYRDLAAAAGLYYYRLPSDKPDNETYGAFHDQDFFDKCDGDVRHISSPAAFLDYECNSRSKGSPVLINMAKLQATMELALDDIGCRDGFCHEGGGDGWEGASLFFTRRARIMLSANAPLPTRPQSSPPSTGWGYRDLRKKYKEQSAK